MRRTLSVNGQEPSKSWRVMRAWRGSAFGSESTSASISTEDFASGGELGFAAKPRLCAFF